MSCCELYSPYLFWSRARGTDSDLYQMARKIISERHGEMPSVESGDLDMSDFFKKNPNATLYYPVFAGASGWWGELLGGAANVREKIALSPNCNLMVITRDGDVSRATNKLFAAEIFPNSGFFRKLPSAGASVADMLATDSGTILGLFAGKNQNKFQNFIESGGNFYLGCIGGY
ncbi:MAG: hypothetical protein LBL75_01075 [Rickettsiales bacterium]|jgi:hypothetical protein|nr:hypothetical protein [Rickettsiales bacterium]